MHHHRTEHWIVVTGTAEVEIDAERFIIGENKSIYIEEYAREMVKQEEMHSIEIKKLLRDFEN